MRVFWEGLWEEVFSWEGSDDVEKCSPGRDRMMWRSVLLGGIG